MPDREKVIKAIEICYTAGHNCTECPLFNEDACNDRLMRDALTLIREQEAVEPTAKDEAIRVVYNCGGCGSLVGFVSTIHDDMQYRAKFCPECGRKVAWS